LAKNVRPGGYSSSDFGCTDEFLAETLGQSDVKAAIRAGAHEGDCKLGQAVIANRGVNNSWLDSEIALMTHRAVRSSEVPPRSLSRYTGMTN
jgi:hypothetical protein